MKNELTILVGQREIKCQEKRESKHRPWIIFLVFCSNSNMCLFTGFIFTSSQWVWDPFAELTPKLGPQLSVVFISLWLVFNIFISGSQLTLFLSSFEFLQPIRTCCWFAADTFLFLVQASAAIPVLSFPFISHFSCMFLFSTFLWWTNKSHTQITPNQSEFLIILQRWKT